MKSSQNGQSKILNHAAGMGAVSADQVVQRARELATIDGREAEGYTDADWELAKRELHGGHDELDNTGDLEVLIAARSIGAVSGGHHTENHSGENDTSLGEELVAEGLDEAEHEQMLEARRAQDKLGE